MWTLEQDAQLPDFAPQNRERLPRMIQKTIQMAQRLLYRSRAQDWPWIFYALCILLLVQGDTDAHLWTEATDRGSKETRKAIQELCHLFHLTTRNTQPLSSDFDIKRYAILVDDNEQAVEHYRRMHELWMANSEFLHVG